MPASAGMTMPPSDRVIPYLSEGSDRSLDYRNRSTAESGIIRTEANAARPRSAAFGL